MNRVYFLVLSLIAITLLAGCVSQHDFEKQEEFEAHFSEGMSVAEVEKILSEIGEYEFVDEWEFSEGDIRLEYRTESRKWGSPTYYFRFTPNGELVTLFSINP